MANKKEIERLWLDEIAKLDPDFPSGVIIEGKNPDFIIKGTDKATGIELASYYRGQGPAGSNKKRNEVLRQEVIKEAQKEFERTHDIPLIVNVFSRSHPDLSSADIAGLASAIVRIVSENVPNKNYAEVRVGYEQFDSSLLEQCSSLIIIHRANDLDTWHIVSFDWTDASSSELDYVVSTHGQNVGRYLTNCSEVWLYIVADSHNLSSSITSTEILEKRGYQSKFTTIRLYNRASGTIIKLQ